MTEGDDAGSLLHRLVAAVESGDPVAVATIVETHNAAPRHAGTKMLVYADGRCEGTLGGGALEARVAADARASLVEGSGRLVRYDLRELGMCAGEMTVYVEPQLPPPTVLVIGCGHIGRAVVELAHWLGFHVIAADDRVELATRELLPDADVLLPGPIEQSLRSVEVTPRTHAVLATRSTEVDLDVLPLLLASPARSIGVLGSRRRWQETRDALLARGVAEEALDRVRTPIGLDLPAVTPRELALAILGEVLETRG